MGEVVKSREGTQGSVQRVEGSCAHATGTRHVRSHKTVEVVNKRNQGETNTIVRIKTLKYKEKDERLWSKCTTK